MPDESQLIELIQIDGNQIDGCPALPAELILAKKQNEVINLLNALVAPFGDITTEKRERTIV